MAFLISITTTPETHHVSPQRHQNAFTFHDDNRCAQKNLNLRVQVVVTRQESEQPAHAFLVVDHCVVGKGSEGKVLKTLDLFSQEPHHRL